MRWLVVTVGVLVLVLLVGRYLFVVGPFAKPGRLDGVVVDGEGHPLSGVTILRMGTTAQGNLNLVTPLTNAQGEFTFGNVPPGHYTLSAEISGRTPQTQQIQVLSGKTVSLRFVLK